MIGKISKLSLPPHFLMSNGIHPLRHKFNHLRSLRSPLKTLLYLLTSVILIRPVNYHPLVQMSRRLRNNTSLLIYLFTLVRLSLIVLSQNDICTYFCLVVTSWRTLGLLCIVQERTVTSYKIFSQLTLEYRTQRLQSFGSLLVCCLLLLTADLLDRFGWWSQSRVQLNHKRNEVFELLTIIFMNFRVLTFQDLLRDVLNIFPLKRPFFRQHLIKQTPKRPNIRLTIISLPFPNFRTSIRKSPSSRII